MSADIVPRILRNSNHILRKLNIVEQISATLQDMARVERLVEIEEQDLYLLKKAKKEYIACLKSSGYQSEKCRHLSKKYLECRMERNLMAKQDLSELGFLKDRGTDTSEESTSGGQPNPSPAKNTITS